MSNDLVVIDNAIVNATYELSVNEQRLIFSAIAQIPKNVPVEANRAYCVTRDDFIKLGVHPDTVAREIRTATKDLMKRTLRMNTEIGELEFTWLKEVLRYDKHAEEKLKAKYPNTEDYGKYIQMLRAYNLLDSFALFRNEENDNVVVRLVFNERITPFLTELKDNFTQFGVEDIAGFGSTYSIRIYQAMMQFKSTGYRKMSLKDLRYMLALGDKYDATKDLKVRVIDTAVNEINGKSPYKVTYELLKTGRKFTHLELKFKRKEPLKKTQGTEVLRDLNTNVFFNMSDAQINMYGNQLADIRELGNMAHTGESAANFASRIKIMLKDPEQQKQFHLYLKQLGFKGNEK